MKWSDFDDYLTADHLGGKAFTLQIREIKLEDFFDRESRMQEQKPVLYFNGTDKGLVVTSPNRKTLKGLFGDEVTACFGKRVTIRAERVTAFGKEHWPIRIVEAIATASACAANKPNPSDALMTWARDNQIPQDAVQHALDTTAANYADARNLLEREYVMKPA